MKGRVAVLFLALLGGMAALRLVWVTAGFVRSSLQLDLAAYLTAGEAVRFGLDPYRTHPDHTPPVWDGKSPFLHSRFLYPPLVAWSMAPLSALPFPLAKGLFTASSLAALLLATALLWRDTAGGRSTDDGKPTGDGKARLLALLAFLLSSWPLLTLLERGQVDAFTLLCVVMAFRPLLRGRAPGLAQGGWLALAVLLKLNAVYLAAFWALRRFGRGLLGFALAGAGLVALSVATDARGLLRYASEELPRIARFGENGPPSMRLPEETLERLREGAPEGFVRREGRPYVADTFGFVANASLARPLARELRGGGWRMRPAAVSVALVAFGLALAARVRRGGAGRRPGPESSATFELAFLSLALSTVLLAGPLTWAMNTVWLVAGGVLAARAFPGRHPRERLGLGVLLSGLLLVWAPDQYAAPALYPVPTEVGDLKYVAGELLVLAGSALLAWIRPRS